MTVAKGLASGEKSCDCRWEIGQWAGVLWNRSPRARSFLIKDVDCGRQGKDVDGVNVVVLPFRPPLSKVQQLKRKVCTVGWKSGGGNTNQDTPWSSKRASSSKSPGNIRRAEESFPTGAGVRD